MPRPDMVTVDHTATVSPRRSTSPCSTASAGCRCYDDDEDDDVVGVVYTKDLIRAERDGGGDRPVTELVRDVHVVPETKPVAG